jgi:hypothetical protein
MPSYSAYCFDSGLFTMLSVVLNSNTPGYPQFYAKALESWQTLGLPKKAIQAIVLRKEDRKAEEIRDALRTEMPFLIGKSYGDIGRCYYELGFWCGTLLLGLMSNIDQVVKESIQNLKYKCAEAKNPQPMREFVKTSESQLAINEKIDMVRVASFAEEFHLWALANVQIECRKSLKETILAASIVQIPYFGKALKAIYEHRHTEDRSGKKKPWWKLW